MPTMTEIAERLEKILMGLGLPKVLMIVAVLSVGFFYVVSRVYGWHDLARHYAAANRYQGEWITHPEREDGRYGGLVVYFNNGVSENAINLGADREGLYLAMSLGFRLFHPPLFVPWSEVTSTAVKEVPWLKKKNLVRFTFALCPNIPVEVDSYVAGEVEKRSEGRWTVPELD